jgi:hypothetical protein
VDFDYLKYNNPQNTETEFWKFLGGFITKFTSQFTVRGNLGIALVNTKADTLPVTTGANNLPPPLPPPLPGDPFVVNPNAPPPLNPVQGAGSAIDWIGDIFLTYRDKTTTYSLFASRYISPNTTGELQQRQTVGAAIRHEINSRSGLTLASSYGLTSSGGENATKSGSLSATAAYDFSWTREFRGQLAYTYRRNFTGEQQTTTTSIVPFVPVDNSPITSHGVYVVFTKDFTIKP